MEVKRSGLQEKNGLLIRSLGQDPFCPQKIWETLFRRKLLGLRGMARSVYAALDIALWGILRKSTQEFRLSNCWEENAFLVVIRITAATELGTEQ